MNLSGIDTGLLRFCLEHSDGPSTNVESTIPQRDPEDYKWLREALNNLETDADRMKKLVEMIKLDNSVQAKVAALEELEYLVEDLDNANDLHKLNGYEAVLTLVNDQTSADLRYWSTWVVATVLQNNPWSQAKGLEKGTLNRLLLLLQDETEDRVLSKAVLALSALIRDQPKAVEAFLKANSLRLLAYMLTSTKGDGLSSTTKMKVASLLAYLCHVVPLVRHAVREYSLLKPLVDAASHAESEDLREKMLMCLIEATKDNGLNIEACREMGLLDVRHTQGPCQQDQER